MASVEQDSKPVTAHRPTTPHAPPDNGPDARLARIHELEGALEVTQAEVLSLRADLEALGEQLRRYRELFDFAPLPFFLLDRAGIIGLANLCAADLTGTPRSALEGMPLLSYVTRESRAALLEHLRCCRSGPGPARSEILLTGSHGGTQIPVEIHTHCVAGDREALLTTLIDLSDRRRAETERRHAAEAESVAQAKDDLLTAIGHELRTPLAPIANLIEVLQLSEEVPDQLRPMLEIMQRNLWMEVRLVDDLLDAARIRRSKLKVNPEPLDLHELLRQSRDMLEPEYRQQDVALALHLEASASHIHADPARISQVFSNLLHNALKFTPDGGRVSVRTLNSGPGLIRILVEDNGEGIDPATIDTLFDPFSQAHEGHHGGLGLGLAIARGIVDRHSGSIEAHSDGAGRGATFVVTLPLADD